MSYVLIMSTCGDEKEAEKLAKALVLQKLAACVQLSPITSFYTWDNKACMDKETRLVIKTKAALYSKVEQFILDHHSYEVPQIVQLPFEGGLPEYLSWIDENTDD